MLNSCLVINRRSLMLRISITIAILIAAGGIGTPQSQAQIPKENVKEDIKIRLNDLNDVSEWVRLERIGKQVKLIHTVVAPNGLVKTIGSLSPIPIPPLEHTWYDHPTTGVSFQPEGCIQPSCTIAGANTLELPEGSDLSKGQFTVSYTESNLQRSVTFKVPPRK
jgi:hypothetical protein